MKNRKISKLAIASFASGLVFIVGFLGLLNLIPSLYARLLIVLSCCLLAIVCGALAIVKIKKNKETLKGLCFSILGIIFGVTYMSIIFLGMHNQVANTGKTVQSDLLGITKALDIYYMDHGIYPLNEHGLGVLSTYYIIDMSRHTTGIPADPWGNEYQYSFSLNDGTYKLFSLGKDGVKSKDDIYLIKK